jgi:hypothetical protein
LASDNVSCDADNVNGGRILALIPLAARKRQRPVVIGPVVVGPVIVGSVVVGVFGSVVAGVSGPVVARAPDMVLRNVVILMVVRVVV